MFLLLHSFWDKIFFLTFRSQTPIRSSLISIKTAAKINISFFLRHQTKRYHSVNRILQQELPKFNTHLISLSIWLSHFCYLCQTLSRPKFSKGLLDTFIFWSYHAFWWRDMKLYTTLWEMKIFLSVTTWLRWSEMSRPAVG